MTSEEMLRAFKIGTDKIDSDSYPELYPEQIFFFINKAISRVVNEGRVVFEKTQTITDNLKALIPPPANIPAQLIPETNQCIFDLTTINYWFYISSTINTQVGDRLGKAQVKTTQHNDINSILNDPYNSPKPYKVPITFSRDSIIGYGTSDFEIISIDLIYVEAPAIVSRTVNCNLDPQIHHLLVDEAITEAYKSLGLITNNTQEKE